jgi:hypothetical protein
MGQYWKAVNLDKKEFINPHDLGAGLKLWEIIANGDAGVGVALCILLAEMPERRGGGDLEEHPYIGRWVGDRVALVGDYAQEGDKCYGYYPTEDNGFVDITAHVAEIIENELNGKYEGDGWKSFVRK